MLVASAAVGQTRAVSGRVTDATGSGLPGVTVLEQGTSNGTSTNADGSFTLNVQPGATLVVSSIGFETQNVAVGDRSSVAVTLKTNATQLGEAIVVGYGTQVKRELTGSVTQLGSKDVENVPVVSFEQAIQGRTPGVQINQGSGKLGAGVQIRVRGASSITASNQPLYVIDGIPVTSQDVGSASGEPLNPLADLNPSDIESITILKDAASSAIYGSRASNGVVLVTTKRGRSGDTRVTVGAYFGRQEATKLRKFLNADQYKELFSESILNSPFLLIDPNDPDADYASVADAFAGEAGLDLNSTENTPWSELAFRKGSVQQYDASVSGGDAKTRFFLSGSYSDQQGIIIGNRYRRGSLRANLDHSLSEKVRIGLNLSLTRSVNDRVADDNAFSNPVQLNALPPIQAANDPTDPTGLNRNTLYYNALLQVDNAENRSGNYRSFGNVSLAYEPIKGLIFRTENGYDFLNLNERIYQGRFTEDGAPTGYGLQNQLQGINYTTNNTVTWLKTLGEEHTLEALGGFSFQRYDQQNNSSEGRGFPNDQFKRIASAARITAASSGGTGYTFLSYLSRVNYTFRNRYLASVSARLDGSSRFSPDNQYGVFPAASVGWIVSEEGFLKDNNVLSFLKFRGSYGLTGNSEIGNFSSRRLYSAIPYADVAGIQPTGLGNPDLTWETTKQADIGVEFGFLNGRIAGEVDVYEKITNDLLLDLQLPYTGGYPIVTRNIGDLRNRGIEFSLNTRNLDGDFKWLTNFNLSINRNKITNLNGQEIIAGGRNLGRVREGEPIGVFWGVEYAGVDPANGDALYYLNTTNPDGSINRGTTNDYSAAAEAKLGDPNPDFTGGLTNTFTFKGFELSILNQFVKGNDIYNIGGVFQSVNGDYFDNQTLDQLERWQNPGDITDVPQARLYEGNGTAPSSRWISDGSFFRFKNVTLGYTLPNNLLKPTGIRSARVYVTAQNLFTITNYDGYDPEVNTTSFGRPSYLLGHDFYTPPLAKTWLIGFNLGF
ncbi:SusC/RagA family TonB-linked outer membrane protein [Hymenobacter piscis]|uniref:SusC/RagA family TonB-linked outer membrane protein n=1 Tax=Hymenobacter piscis TaxID=2839984 RepID=UPI00293D998E|nr:TonB-dependent receptor [Hymenobacter piscis]